MFEQIKTLMDKELDIDLNLASFDEKTPLFEGGLAMDSIVFTEFILLLEKAFNFEYDDDELTVENFETLGVIIERIKQKLN
ncbi:acyl carrier protein [Pseudoalteromonas sp. JBTF-M23]|uniref:Acyl carrier protein n=1 Tax=Pseudoalteromonas caenipelagi TaxID=2726988 RepID=A0A849VGW7_9GAMM|nr:phosphopantetheine-binding protein [Pseudoalteromonas caenipelagi]NOU51948.1 acyl carrier protein [Pseudoalteromonas caenipelagi]